MLAVRHLTLLMGRYNYGRQRGTLSPVSRRMTERHSCPLCPETYEERTDLRVHLEVEHRKSEIVSHLIDAVASADRRIDADSSAEDQRPRPTA